MARVIFLLLRLGVGAIFVYAGVTKIWDFSVGKSATGDFFEAVLNYRLTTWNMAWVIAVYLPWLEVIAGLALFVRRCAAGAAILVNLLTLTFIAALGSAWARGLDIRCGCFGRDIAPVNFPLHLAGLLALLAATGAVLWSELRLSRAA